MTKWFCVILLFFIASQHLFAKDTLRGGNPLYIEFQAGQSMQTRYWNIEPFMFEAVRDYYFSSGWEYTLSLAAPFGRRMSYATRWKRGIYGNMAGEMEKAFHARYPDLQFTVSGDKWKMNQLNAGLTFNFPFEKTEVEIGQYAGMTIIRIPYLKLVGYGPDHPEALLIRKPQKHNFYSLYTTFSGKYNMTSRRYIFLRAEFAFHRIKEQRIELATVFGLSGVDTYYGDSYMINYSLNLGLGWRLGKR